MIEKAIAVYGLKGNPFAQKPLDPMQRTDDAHLVAPVDGWKRRDELQEFLKARVDDHGSAIVVVSGSSGTGRTSLANVAIDDWRQHRGADERMVVVRWSADDFDPSKQLWRWALRIRSFVLQARIRLSDATEKELAELKKGQPAAVGASLSDALQLVVQDLADQGAALVGVIEGINDKGFLTLAKEAVEFVEMLMIMTVDRTRATEEKVMSETVTVVEPGLGHVVQLRELSGLEVCALLDWRWQRFSDAGSPFDPGGIASTFDAPPRSLSRALKLAEALLALKAKSHEAGPWPGEHGLFLSAEDIGDYVRIVDGVLLPGMAP